MEYHEIEIEISSDGEVKLQFQGVKGKTCLSYAELLEKIVGKIKDVQLTSEYYEPDQQVKFHIEKKQKQRESLAE